MLSLHLQSLDEGSLKSVPSHLTWIEEDWITKSIHRSALGRPPVKTMKDYIAGLRFLRRDLGGDQDQVVKKGDINGNVDGEAEEGEVEDVEVEVGDKGEGENGNEENGTEGAVGVDGESESEEDEEKQEGAKELLNEPPSMHFVSTKLTRAAFLAYIGKYQIATKYLNDVLARKDALQQVQNTSYQAAITYTVEVLQWAIRLMETGKSDESVLASLKEKWENLQKDEKSKAVIAYFQGDLGNSLWIFPNKVLKLRRDAVKLDPDCYVWQYKLFQQLRWMRINQLMRSPYPYPSKEEKAACEAVFKLNPGETSCVTKRDRAVILKDTIWRESRAYWNKNEEKYMECVNLLKEALDIGREKNLKQFVADVTILLAEFHLYGKGEKLNWEEGKDLLIKGTEDYPEKTLFWFRLGKLYQFGVRGAEASRNVTEAIRCYKKVLELTPWSYMCLRNYAMILTNEKPENWKKDLLNAYNKALETFAPHSVGIRGKVTVMKGCLLWVFNPEDTPDNKKLACETWLEAVKNTGHFMGFTCRSIRAPQYILENKERVRIPVEEVTKELEQLKTNYSDEKLLTNFSKKLAEKPRGNRRMMRDA